MREHLQECIPTVENDTIISPPPLLLLHMNRILDQKRSRGTPFLTTHISGIQLTKLKYNIIICYLITLLMWDQWIISNQSSWMPENFYMNCIPFKLTINSTTDTSQLWLLFHMQYIQHFNEIFHCACIFLTPIWNG